MSLVKDIKGNTAEAFDLIMRKQFAWDILEGRKRVEFRDTTKFYMKRFFKDLKKFELREDVRCIHFHDYGNTWYLDVVIERICVRSLTPEDIGFFHEYGHHEYDEEIKANEGKTEAEAGYLFCLPILAVLSTNLVSADKLREISRLPVANLCDFVKETTDV